VLVVEIMGAQPGTPAFDLRILDAYDVHEACREALVETMGQYGCENCQVLFCRPGTLGNLRLAVEAVKELPLVRMAPVGRVA
jgi:hypothetical protein